MGETKTSADRAEIAGWVVNLLRAWMEHGRRWARWGVWVCLWWGVWGGQARAVEVTDGMCGDQARILYGVEPDAEALAALDGPPDEEAAAPVEASALRSMRLRCDVPSCRDPEQRRALLRVTGWQVGMGYDARALPLVRDRLLRTGYFAGVEVKATPTAQGVDVVIETTGLRQIREVRFHGEEPLFESDLRKRLFLRPGRPLLDAGTLLRSDELKDEDRVDVETAAKIEAELRDFERGQEEQILLTEAALRKLQRRQQESLVALYRKEGYRGTQAQLCFRPVDATFVDIDVYIDSGKRFRLGKVYTRNHKVLTYEQVFSIFTSEFGLSTNFSAEGLDQATKNLIERYRDMGYLRARVNKGYREDPVREAIDVYLEIDEGYRWDITFQGHKHFKLSELQDVLTFKKIGYVDTAEIENSVIELRALYQTSGFYWVQIDSALERIDADTVQVRFKILEGERADVRSVRFCKVDAPASAFAQALIQNPLSLPCLPLEAVRSDDLVTMIQTQSGAFLQLSQLATDTDAVVAYYQQSGYLQAQLPRWQVRGERRGRDLHITLWVEEGPRTEVTSAQVVGGDPSVHADALSRLSILKPREAPEQGQSAQEPIYWSPVSLSQDLATLLKPYRSQGYALTSVRAVCSPQLGPLDTAQGVEGQVLDRTAFAVSQSLQIVQGRDTCQLPSLPDGCLPADPAALCERGFNPQGETFIEDCAHTFDRANDDPAGAVCSLGGGLQGARMEVRAELEAGPLLRVGEFFFHGNFKTRRSVIRESFSMRKGDPFDTDELIKARGRLRARTIFASASVETLGLNDSKEAQAVLPLSDVHLIVTVEEGEQRWIDSALGASIVAGNTVLNAEAEYVEANVWGYGVELRWYNLVEIDILDFIESDGQVCDCNVFSLLTYRDPLSFFFGMELLAQAFFDRQLILALEKEEFGLILEVRKQFKSWVFFSGALEQKWTASRIKADALFTPDGDRLFQPFISTTSLIPRVRLDRRDSPLNPTSGWYLDMRWKLGARSIQNQEMFLKTDIEGGWFQPLGRHLVLGFGGRFGKAWLFGLEQLQTDERFLLGGVRSVRGFTQDILGPTVGGTAIGGELLINTNLELRFPILQGVGLQGALFFDTGSLVNTLDELSWYDLRMTAGLGFRMVLGGTFPIILDYGVVLDRRPGEPFGGLQVNIGYAF
jgi:outer membrane protein assembly factor BamA